MRKSLNMNKWRRLTYDPPYERMIDDEFAYHASHILHRDVDAKLLPGSGFWFRRGYPVYRRVAVLLCPDHVPKEIFRNENFENIVVFSFWYVVNDPYECFRNLATKHAWLFDERALKHIQNPPQDGYPWERRFEISPEGRIITRFARDGR